MYKEASLHKNTNAMCQLAIMYTDGEVCEKNYLEAISLLDEAITLRNNRAKSLRADMHNRGLGGDINTSEAVRLFKEVAKCGSTNGRASAMCVLAIIDIDNKNYQEAAQHLDKAISLGFVHAMFLRAIMSLNQHIEDINYLKAINLLDDAVLIGDSNALVYRADMYRIGLGGDRNFSEALRLLNHAIEMNNHNAFYGISQVHYSMKNYSEAIYFLEISISCGHIPSMSSRAYMYLKGHGGDIDYEKAIELFDRAIELSDVEAMYSRAEMYERGFGSAIDMVSAARLYRKYLVSREEVDEEVEAKLKSSSDVIFQFHYAMLHKDFSKVGTLAETSNLVIKELVEYELQCNLTHEDIDIEEFFTQCTRDLVDTRINAFCWSVLLSIYGMEKEGEIISAHLISLRLNCLSAIDITSLRGDNLITIIEMVINIWYCTSEFSSKTADMLCQTMHGLSFYRAPIDDQFLRSIALIIIRTTYGDRYEASFDSINTFDIILLINN